MNKSAIIAFFAVLILATAIVTATELPKGPCKYTRPATEFREAREFQGVYLRYHGEIICGSPGDSKAKQVQKAVESVQNAVVLPPTTPEPPVTPPEPVCETNKVCHTEYVWACNRHGCHKYPYQVCEDVTTCI